MELDRLKLNMMYAHAPHMGYGRMAVSIAAEFAKMNVEVYDHLAGTDEIDSPAQNSMRAGRADHLNTGRNSGKANVLLWCTVPSHGAGWWKGQVSCILTMWEAMRLPESFRESLPNYDTVIVPSRHNEELFSQFHPRVKYVPLGIDPDIWKYRERRPPERFFRYLIGGSGKRKGTDLAFAAFNKVWGKEGSWGSGPIPVLQMKSPKAEDFYGPRVERITGHISAQEEVDLYANAHCYLQPSRGEGFSLQPLQAIAQGCPTVLTDAHGQAAFSRYGYPLSWKPEPSAYFVYGRAGDWWEPSLDDLCDHMKWVYENYDAACSFGRWAGEEVREEFTWKRTANGVLDALGRDRLTDYDGPDEWFEPEILLYPIVLKRRRQFDIGTHRYIFEPGVEYWAFADVKRVLFEGGELDPSCLHDDDPKNCGLAKSQIDKVGGYRADQGNCPTCGRPLVQDA